MFLLYVDESGDIGLNGSPCDHFCLSGLVVHELRWQQTLDAIIAFRRHLRSEYGLKLREEIHAAHFLHKPRELARIPKSMRLRLLRDVLDFQASLPDVNVINIALDKSVRSPGFDVFDFSWKALVQRFHNTISHLNFPGPANATDMGLLIVDRTDEKKLRAMTRRMRRFNPVPSSYGMGSRNLMINTLVEDPVHRDSLHSYFIQLADVNAYFLFQKLSPCGYVKRKGARNYFDRLGPILCKQASRSDPQGIVRL
ncbi:MAG: DUF3800 domain-containing protein [Deltaproteobacteria bacterium]|nr:MAG: DUF3800 domain-containing protein [Deltaproteobacteria bacterium]